MIVFAEIYRPMIPGLAGGLVVAILIALAYRSRPDRYGWSKIRPGYMHYFGLSMALSIFLLLTYAFIGESLQGRAESPLIQTPDDVWRIGGAWALLAAGTAYTTALIHRIRRANVEWKGAQIVFDTADGRQRFFLMNEINAIDYNLFGNLRIAFQDGTILAIDKQSRGTEALLDQIAMTLQWDETLPPRGTIPRQKN